MDIRDRRGLKDKAQQRLQAASYSPGKLILLHTGVSVAMLLVLTVLNFILQNGIDATGGLSGLGTRTILSTIQTILQSLHTVALPFWEFGYIFAILRISRGQEARPGSLLDGFRNFGPVIRYYLLYNLIFTGFAIVSFYPASFLFMLTPAAGEMKALLEPMVAGGIVDPNQLMMDPALQEVAAKASVPMLILFAVIFCLISAPLFYRLRMAEFALADDPRAGVRASMYRSNKMMKGNCFKLLALDISFWWFYIAQLVISVICYADMLLPALGITLPFSATTAYFLFYVINLALQLLLYWGTRNKVMLTYAAAYDVLREQPAVEDTKPAKQPWNYE